MKTKYKNPWHKADQLDTYGPKFYETEARAIKAGPYLVYQRLKGVCWDWVKDGVCLTQRAGFSMDLLKDKEFMKDLKQREKMYV
jgi:hypothetical protein